MTFVPYEKFRLGLWSHSRFSCKRAQVPYTLCRTLYTCKNHLTVVVLLRPSRGSQTSSCFRTNTSPSFFEPERLNVEPSFVFTNFLFLVKNICHWPLKVTSLPFFSFLSINFSTFDGGKKRSYSVSLRERRDLYICVPLYKNFQINTFIILVKYQTFYSLFSGDCQVGIMLMIMLRD